MNIASFGSDLVRGSDGIWYSRERPGVAYPEDGSEVCFSVEDRSFWFRHRNRCIIAAANLFSPPDTERTIVDVGGGNGYVSWGLTNAGFNAILLEPGQKAVHNAKKRGLVKIICASLESACLRRQSLPSIGLFDVLEHIDDEQYFLRMCRELLTCAGRLYITVPAYHWLWSREDLIALHFRRYTLRRLSQVLTESGFRINLSTYIFRCLPVPIFLYRTIPSCVSINRDRKGGAQHDHCMRHSFFSDALEVLLKKEAYNISRGKRMSFGGSCLIVATKN